MASLRRGRRIEKRVVIAVAGPERMSHVLEEAKSLEDELTFNDLLVIPYVLGSPDIVETLSFDLPDCIAVPTGGTPWRSMVEDEMSEATNQGIDVKTERFSIILKKNGRIGQRARGIFLRNMVADVSARASMGMDVTNI